MKIITCLEDAREAILRSFEFIKGVPENLQADTAASISNTIKDIDRLLFKLNLKPREKPQSSYSTTWWDIENLTKDYKVMVLRLEPQKIKDVKISGYLKTYDLPTTLPEVIEDIGVNHGGGKYSMRLVDAAGKQVRTKTFEISGMPNIPTKDN